MWGYNFVYVKFCNEFIFYSSWKSEKSTHKYGIEIPTSIEHARAIDKANSNTLWQDTINKEMCNVSITFQILEEDKTTPPGWTKSSGHIIFDVKMDFTRKAR
jgi:hypothetical protein